METTTMALKSLNIKVDGETYTVHELPVSVILPLANKLSESGPDAQIELIGKAVSLKGERLGPAAGEMGASVFMKIISKVLEVNGLGGELGNEN